MANPVSSIRSAARATSSAYRTLPIRWRLAGGSAVLTLVILLGFAAIVGVLTQRRIYSDFDAQVARAADKLASEINLEYDFASANIVCTTSPCPIRNPDAFSGVEDAVVRFVDSRGMALSETADAPDLGPPQVGRIDSAGYRVEARSLPVARLGFVYLQFARKLSDVKATVARVRVFLIIGVFAGALLALLAGLANARRAMRPVSELSDVARRIERTRDPSLSIPKPLADDEVRELADTLEDMLHSLDAARSDTESALTRQREFVADASHELRTPLTAVLANLELLEEELQGDQRETAAAALRSTRRMRRLVADLLLLARADAGREAARSPVDLSSVVVEAAAQLEPVAGEHRLVVTTAEDATVDGTRDELHRLALNLMDNALKHTDPGTEIRATVNRAGDEVVLVVEDDGPGVPADIAPRIFERFVRGDADRGGSSGLGLSIVRAVAETHGGTVALEAGTSGYGARFVVRLAASGSERPRSSDAAANLITPPQVGA